MTEREWEAKRKYKWKKTRNDFLAEVDAFLSLALIIVAIAFFGALFWSH